MQTYKFYTLIYLLRMLWCVEFGKIFDLIALIIVQKTDFISYFCIYY